MPAASLLLDLLFLLEPGEDAVQVVLLDVHLGGQLGDRDPGLSCDERQCLSGTRATALATARTATGSLGCGGRGGCRARCLCGLGCLGRTSTACACGTALGATGATRAATGRCGGGSGRSAGGRTGS